MFPLTSVHTKFDETAEMPNFIKRWDVASDLVFCLMAITSGLDRDM